MASKREEHVVERWLTERERRDSDSRPGQLRDRCGGLIGVRARGRERCRVRIEAHVGLECPREDACRVGSPVGVEQADMDAPDPTEPFS